MAGYLRTYKIHNISLRYNFFFDFPSCKVETGHNPGQKFSALRRYNLPVSSPLFGVNTTTIPVGKSNMATWILPALRWSARVTGLLLVGLVLIIIVGEGPPNPFRQPPPVQIEFLGMFLMVVGFLAGWRWEAIGGLLAMTGFALFAATELIVNGRPPGGAIPLFAIPGVLYLLSYCAVHGSRASGLK